MRTFATLGLSFLIAAPLLGGCGSTDSSDSKAPPTTACTPATGHESAVPLGAIGSSRYSDTAMVLDDQGNPLIAFVAPDPNDDGDRSDTALYFVSYDAKTCTWNAPVRVATTGDIDTTRDREVTLTRDPSTGQLGIGYQVVGLLSDYSTQVMLAQSSDGGRTWSSEEIARDGATEFATDNTLTRPTVAMKNGKTFFAYYETWVLSGAASNGSDANAFHLLSRTGTSGAFTDTLVPPVADAPLPGAEGDVPALAIDDEGNAGFVYLASTSDDSANLRVCYYRSGQPNAVAVFDSLDQQNDGSGLSLVFEGTQPRIAVALERGDDPDGSSIWFSSSSDGAAWSTPVELPKDGGDGMGWNLAIASNGKGQLSIAAESESSNGERSCGAPKLATSNDDGSSWSTCGPSDADGGYLGAYVQMAVDANGKRILVSSEGDDVAATGVSVWREP